MQQNSPPRRVFGRSGNLPAEELHLRTLSSSIIKKKFQEVKEATRKVGGDGETKRRLDRLSTEMVISTPTGELCTATTTSTTLSATDTTTSSLAAHCRVSVSILHDPTMDNVGDPAAHVTIAQLLKQGTLMTKVSVKRQQRGVLKLDSEKMQIVWEGKKRRIIPTEQIKELRSASDARYYREQCQVAQEYEDRWLTIIWSLDGAHKMLHLIASSRDILRMWDNALHELHVECGDTMNRAVVEAHASLGSTLSASIKRTFQGVKDATRIGSNATGGAYHERQGSTPIAFDSALASPMSVDRDDEGADVTVPQILREGTLMTKVSAKKHKRAVFRLDPDIGQIIWEGKKHRIIPIENIKELRSGSDARYYREQFQLVQEYEDRWLTIVYILDGAYKTLHLIAPSKEVFRTWDKTLRELHAIRQELMSGLGNIEMRQAIWEKQYWKGAGEDRDQKLGFEEVEKLCRRLNINSSSHELLRLFKQADTLQRNFLDFQDFRRFVKLLKGRPEIDRLYKKLCTGSSAGVFDITVFEKFMREEQKSSLSPLELQAVFERHSEPLPPTQARAMTIETFTSFLLSPDNSAFLDQHGRVWHDMTRPLSDYYVSSSHNTYLVGHQLVGESTIEGYIRALLHSCRSVELDIYDGEQPSEPQIFHGKTLTSKVSLREVCHAIWKYGFVTSPYPIIISAEVHCSLAGQDAIALIMKEVFGGALVQAPHVGVIEKLPSPEELKGRILLKTKNLHLLGRKESLTLAPGIVGESEYELTDTSISASSSTSDSDVVFDQKRDRRRRESDSNTVKELKDDFLKVGSHVLQQVRSVGKSAAPKVLSLQQPWPVLSNPRTAGSLPVAADASSAPSSSLFGSSSSSPTPLYTGPAYPQAPMPLTPGSVLSPELHTTPSSATKLKMSPALLSLLVYTVGVKCRGINKKEFYAPEHMFSLSETVANRMLKSAGGMMDLIKHCRTHLVRVYPKGTRIGSTNFDPHRFWSAGAQLVAINWQTFDLGYMINRAMFQRNGRAGYVLKPPALLSPAPAPAPLGGHPPGIATPTTPAGPKDLLAKRTKHVFDVTIVSAQQLPPPRDASSSSSSSGGVGAVDPLVEVSLHVPEWPGAGLTPAVPAKTGSVCTGLVKRNGFNPVWEERLKIPFECVGEMRELVFVRFAVRSGEREDVEPLAVYCASLGSLGMGYRHLPLHDTQLSQYLFSTLFVRIAITDS